MRLQIFLDRYWILLRCGLTIFDVVSRAYERASLSVTTNLPFAEWVEVLGSERLTRALLDQLTHRVNILESNGESYRLKEARRHGRGLVRTEAE